MTKHELERMISLADDKYIEEAFEQKIQVKKRFPIAIPFAAAAAVVCGLFFAARSAETEINDMVASEVTTVTVVTEMDEYNENLRYWKYFDGDKSVIEEIQYEKESMVYIFQNAYTHVYADLPFEYKANGLQIYCNDEGNPLYMYVTISNGATVEGYPKQFGLWVTNCGTPFIGYPLENSTPESVNGIDVYGFEGNDGDLDAYFNIDGIGYTATFNNMQYKDAFEAIEMLIERKLSISDFDISKGTILEPYDVSLSFLNENTPFEGYIPQIAQIGDMTNHGSYNSFTTTTSMNEMIPHSQEVLITYRTDDAKKYIKLDYQMGDCISVSDKSISFYDIDKSYIISPNNNSKPNRFDFRIDCHEFVIDVEAVCTADELWECICAIKGEAMHQTELEQFEQAVKSSYPSLQYPVDGEISAPYGHLQSNFHKGIDFKADDGTPVYAAADGIVIEPVDVDTGDEKNVIISHYTNVNTFYAHLSKVVVSEGDEVKQGDIIGYVGSTGLSTGPHLHFELCIDGEYVDPIDYFTNEAKTEIAMQNELGMRELLENEFSQIHLPNQPAEN